MKTLVEFMLFTQHKEIQPNKDFFISSRILQYVNIRVNKVSIKKETSKTKNDR